MKSRNYVIGVNLNWVLFDGYKSRATKERLKAELFQLKLKEIDEKRKFDYRQKETNRKLFSIQTDINNHQNTLHKHKQRLYMNRRLKNVKQIDMISTLQDKIARLYRQLELNNTLIDKKVKRKELQIRNERN